MIAEPFPTALLFLAGAIALLALPQGRMRGALLLVVPLIAGWQVWTMPEGNHYAMPFFGLEMELMRVDKL